MSNNGTLPQVKELMTSNLITVNPDDTFMKVDTIFRNNKIHHVPVTVDDTVVGIVNKLDYKALSTAIPVVDCEKKEEANRRLFQSLLVGEVMHKNPPIVRDNDTLLVALEVFRQNQEKAVIVLNDDHKIVGILTTYDCLMYFYEAQKAA